MSENIMHDITNRTNGELYIGVVGAVRTGKSTFIKKFLERKIIPYVSNEDDLNKIVDEIPQSAHGKTIMTVEPKFVPNNRVVIKVDDEMEVNVRLVDCVGYIIPNSLGYATEEGPRLVKTPWFEEEIPFYDAAEIGTQKVIENHSNIGIVVTTDGSINDFDRLDYVEAEDKVITKLKDMNTPFVIVLNTVQPGSPAAQELKQHLEEKYKVTVVCVDVENMSVQDIDKILTEALYEFEIGELNIRVPSYLSVLDSSNEYKQYLDNAIKESTHDFKKFREVQQIANNLDEYEYFNKVNITKLDPGFGEAEITIDPNDDLYNKIVVSIIGDDIQDKGQFIKTLQDFRIAKTEYDAVSIALNMVRQTGYGIAMPTVSDMKLENPEVVKHGSRYGVKLKAIAPSIHMIKVDVESTFEPIIGTEDQSKMLIDNLLENSVDDPSKVWSSEIFGRSLDDLVNDGIRAKLHMLPENAQLKFRDTLEKVVNKGRGGIIAIIL